MTSSPAPETAHPKLVNDVFVLKMKDGDFINAESIDIEYAVDFHQSKRHRSL
jgi:hypothetical protein